MDDLQQHTDPPQQAPEGVRCPNCNCGHVPVQATRRKAGRIARYRTCRACGRRFVTSERVAGQRPEAA